MLPDQDTPMLREQYAPLIEHVAESTGLEIEFSIPETYEQLVDWFHEDRIQLAWFGGLTFLHAERRTGARALVTRDVDLEFTTDFLVSRSRVEPSLQEFAGETFAFGPPLSTSGHLMPRYDLGTEGIEPESFFGDVLYSDGHDQTARWVSDGRIDVGAVNSVVVESMFREGRLSADRVRVLRTTPPYRNYVWAIRPDVPPAIRVALVDAFLGLDASIPAHAAILSRLGARGFVPASHADYEELRRAMLAIEENPTR
ncbi:MAG: phosphate/phosphite/phosphonate ABC transporter substrate-binding protein [bacterium]|nr:phosphate/phosphite/phosphonate ABC transporter substrate-binding protein [bacterium]